MTRTGLVKCLVFDEVYEWGKKRDFYRLSKDFNLADAMHFAKHGYEGMPLLAKRSAENFRTEWKELEV